MNDGLVYALYQKPYLYELARLIGYAGLPCPEACEKLKALDEKYGSAKMQTAEDELCDVDSSVDPPVMRLKPEVRKFCWQLLGPPPEHPEYEAWKNNRPWLPPWKRQEEPKEESIQDLSEEQLRTRLHDALQKHSTVSARSKVGKQLMREIKEAEQEFRRRGLEVPWT